ncbi:MAG: phage holin family protein [Planctomycetota bacterium]|nr:phage holin family protein [Planctomycetaceae bacterium]MDQ3330636.1 phage holin family protein [Planctomycetota bacterium]
MPYQTPLNPGRRESPSEGVRNGVSGLVHDVLTLAELQFKLLGVDAKAASGRAIMPTALIGAAAVFAASALPLLLLALAQLLRDQADWPPALATLTAVVVGLVVAGVLGFLGYRGLRHCLDPLARSRDELNRNITWLKSTLKRHEVRHDAEKTVAAGAARGYSSHPR